LNVSGRQSGLYPAGSHALTMIRLLVAAVLCLLYLF